MLCFTPRIYNAYCKGRIVIADSALMTLYIAILSLTMMLMTCTCVNKRLLLMMVKYYSNIWVNAVTTKAQQNTAKGEPYTVFSEDLDLHVGAMASFTSQWRFICNKDK